jgi:hypothetical protein
MSKNITIRTALCVAIATGLGACGSAGPEPDAESDHAPHCKLVEVDGEERLFCDAAAEEEQALLAAPGSGSCGGWGSSGGCIDYGTGCSAECWSCSSG